MMRREVKCCGRIALAALAAVACFVAFPTAGKADIPFRNGETIRLIVPYGPGGGFDRILRLLQPHLESALNAMAEDGKSVTVIVENRPGAGGRVSYEYVYNSPPDGTRMVLLGDQGAALQQLALDAAFDLDEFTYLARVNESDWGILVSNSTGITNMNELIERAQETPILFGSSGAGSGDHIASVLLQKMLESTDVDFPMQHVHFSSSSEVRASMQRGEAEAYIGSVESVLAAVEDGYANMAVIFAEDRSIYYPDTPTIFEQEIPAADEIARAIGITRVLVGPPSIPEDRVAALAEALGQALNSAELKDAAKKAELPIIYGEPEEARQSVANHSEALVRFQDAIKAAVN